MLLFFSHLLWCEVNVFLFFLLVFLCPFICSALLSFIYLFSNTIRPRKIKNELIGIILIGKRFDRE